MTKQLMFFIFLKRKGDRANIKINVVDADTKQPLQYVHIKMSGTQGNVWEAYTDENGVVEFRDVLVDDYTMEIQLMGYERVVKRIRKQDFYL